VVRISATKGGETLLFKRLSLSVVIPALTLFLSVPALTASSHYGKVVAAGDGKLTRRDMAGQNHLTHEVPADATIMCDGKTCGLDDLKAGDVVTLTPDQQGDQTVVTKIEAKTAGS